MKGFDIIVGFTVWILIFQSCIHPKVNENNTRESADSINSQRVNNSNLKRNSDSIDLRNLLITIYKWHEGRESDYHLILKGRSILGLDTVKLNSTLIEMQKTRFFSKNFLVNYKKIGQRVDFLVKHDTERYKAGFINFPFEDYDTWYGGNGGPPDWHSMNIYNLQIQSDNASFKWTCDKPQPRDLYFVRFIREDKKWKLDYLQYMDLKMY